MPAPRPSLRRRVLRRLPVAREALARHDAVVGERDALRDEVRRLRRRLSRQVVRTDYEYLFVVTYGRSGSTLLQGILNSIPGYLIRGENRAALFDLFQLHRKLLKERRRFTVHGPTDSRHPWYGMEGYLPGRALNEFRRFTVVTLLRPEPGHRVIGFKEIRWDMPEFEDYLDFLQQVFPTARFVFNTRNLADVAKSAWWVNAKDPMAKLTGYEASLLAAAERLGERAHVVHYDDYVADPRELKGLFDWLGEEFSAERVQAVLDQPHSY